MRPNPERRAILAGALATAAAVAALAFDPTATVELMRARVYDRLLGLAAPARLGAMRVAVLDIDQGSLDEIGPWPWRRERIGQLIDAALAAGASAVGVDILFAAPETLSPAALARRLADETGDAHARELGQSLTDDDARLAKSLSRDRVALGFALSPEATGPGPATTPTLARGSIDLGALWRGGGGVYPIPELSARSALGALSLPGDADGVVRRAPLLVAAGGELKPGLALEATRLARGASAYLLEPNPQRLVSGELSVALPRDAMLRLAPSTTGIETVAAAQALAGNALSLKGAVVFVGVSAPEGGGLRATAGDPLTPSTIIQAQAARQIAAGFVPLETPPGIAWALGAALGAGLIALAVFTPAPVAFGFAAVSLATPLAASVYAAFGRGSSIPSRSLRLRWRASRWRRRSGPRRRDDARGRYAPASSVTSLRR